MQKLKGKKGVEGEPIINIFGLIIAALVIIVLITFAVNLSTIFFNKPDQGTKESYAGLIKKVTEIKDGSSVEATYYIKPEFALFGFSKDSDKVVYKKPIEIFGTDETKKPNSCAGKACLCLCDAVLCNGNVKDCKIIPDINYYVSDKMERSQGADYASSDGKVNGKYLAVFGKKSGICPACDAFGTRSIKIRRQGDVIYFSDNQK